jgi:putative spermidine/putrescine transport system permease protein
MRTKIAGFAAKAVVIVLLGFILLPALVVAVVAFNDAALIAFPPKEWSLRWFERALTYRDFQNGFYNSLVVMCATAVISVFAGGALAYVIDRYAFVGKTALEAVLTSPLVIPYFTIGIGFLIFASKLGFGRSYTVVVVTHVILVLPFVLRSVYVSLRNLDQRLEMAAAGLGASPWQVLRTITLPLMVPGLFAGVLFSAILSFNEFTASLFVTTQSTQTLPVAMYNYVREYADPSMAALSVIFFILTTLLLTLMNATLGLGKALAIIERE